VLELSGVDGMVGWDVSINVNVKVNAAHRQAILLLYLVCFFQSFAWAWYIVWQ